ncbi:MAG TPA: ExeM/NucH family extracellular endonuclease, partial [Actinotalea sp.]|nr:ExeM/NucH family extracellular endonuclease [Actinotalea sp.]
MSEPLRRGLAGLTAASLVGLGMVAAVAPAQAAVSSSATVLIDEAYGGGGNSGAVYNQDFVELVNTGPSTVDLTGWAVQYASATGSSWQVTPLSGAIPAGASFLVGQAFGANLALPAIDADLVGTIPMSAQTGKVALTSTTTRLTCATGCADLPDVVDFLGWGPTASSFAGSGPAPATTNPTSVARTDSLNTADNAADFTVGAPTPRNLSSNPDPDPDPDPGPSARPIEEIQGTGASSPLVGSTVTTRGVVTAVYPSGGYNGYVLQTPDADRTGTAGASPAVFVYSPATVATVSAGQYLQVTGAVSEYFGLTQLTVAAGAVTVLPGSPSVTPLMTGWPTTDAEREALESVLVVPTGDFTVSNTYSTNQYGEVGLAAGDTPLWQPTDLAAPGTAEAAAVAADNEARRVVLDDGASVNFLSAANSSLTPSYVSLAEPVRVGAPVTFTTPVVVDFRNDLWKLSPTGPMTAGTAAPASFKDDRPTAPDPIGGDLTVASFNVLNYFTTLGVDLAGCRAYTDRAGNGVTVRDGCAARGAWDAAAFARQQEKIVAAVGALDADVVGLIEIENSVVVDGVVDEALATLVDALNAAAGATVWAYVPSSADLPPASSMDVITNALIYRVATVSPTGPSRALGTESAPGGAFANAREPIGQLFTPVDGGQPVFVAVNHFKSTGSAGP